MIKYVATSMLKFAFSFQIFGLKELFEMYLETSRAQLEHQPAKPLASHVWVLAWIPLRSYVS